MGSISGSRRSPGGRNNNPLQHSWRISGTGEPDGLCHRLPKSWTRDLACTHLFFPKAYSACLLEKTQANTEDSFSALNLWFYKNDFPWRPWFELHNFYARASQVAQRQESACRCRRCGSGPWARMIPWRRKGQPSTLAGIMPRTREPGGHPWGLKESDTNERLSASMLYILAEFLNQLSISKHR